MKSFIVPILFFILSVAGIYFDFHGSQGAKKWGIGTFLIICLCIVLYYDIQQKQEDKIQIEKDRIEKENLNKQIDTLDKQVEELKKQIINQIDPAYQELIKQEILDRRGKITISYHIKDKDIEPNFSFELFKKKIEDKKSTIGFKEVIKAVCNPDCRSHTNAIWFGSNVTDLDVKIIATTLINSGLNTIEVVRQYQDPNYRKNEIVIGYDQDAKLCNGLWQRKFFDVTNTNIEFSRAKIFSGDKSRGCRP